MEKPIDELPNDCQRALDVQTRMLVGEAVEENDRRPFEAHLAACPVCRALQESLIKTDETVRSAFDVGRSMFWLRFRPRYAASIRLIRSRPTATPEPLSV